MEKALDWFGAVESNEKVLIGLLQHGELIQSMGAKDSASKSVNCTIEVF